MGKQRCSASGSACAGAVRCDGLSGPFVAALVKPIPPPQPRSVLASETADGEGRGGKRGAATSHLLPSGPWRMRAEPQRKCADGFRFRRAFYFRPWRGRCWERRGAALSSLRYRWGGGVAAGGSGLFCSLGLGSSAASCRQQPGAGQHRPSSAARRGRAWPGLLAPGAAPVQEVAVL